MERNTLKIRDTYFKKKKSDFYQNYCLSYEGLKYYENKASVVFVWVLSCYR